MRSRGFTWLIRSEETHDKQNSKVGGTKPSATHVVIHREHMIDRYNQLIEHMFEVGACHAR